MSTTKNKAREATATTKKTNEQSRPLREEEKNNAHEITSTPPVQRTKVIVLHPRPHPTPYPSHLACPVAGRKIEVVDSKDRNLPLVEMARDVKPEEASGAGDEHGLFEQKKKEKRKEESMNE
jgi:hypothetical protein